MMKTLLYLFSLTLLPLFATAQHTYEINQQYQLKQPVLNTYTKVAADTIGPAILGDTCALQVVGYTASAPQTGYVFGSNSLGDLTILQRIIYDNDGPFLVTGVSIAFADFDESIADRYIYIDLYDDLEADSTFGAPLGTGDSIRVGDILVDDTEILFTNITFPEPILVESDSFLVGIDFSQTYSAPATADGYVGVLSTRDGCGSGRNVLEIVQEGNQTFYTDIYTRWSGLDAEMLLFAAVETDPNTSNKQSVANYDTQVSPNPTDDQLTIRFTAAPGKAYLATLSDLTGRILTQRNATTIGTHGLLNFELADLPAGLYLYHLDGPKGRQTGKVVKR